MVQFHSGALLDEMRDQVCRRKNLERLGGGVLARRAAVQASLCSEALGQTLLNPSCREVTNQSAIALKKCQLVGKYTLQENANTIILSCVCGNDQSSVLCKPQMREMSGFGKNVQMPRRG
jgi:hypothetical protein